jgi:hypothetical protein
VLIGHVIVEDDVDDLAGREFGCKIRARFSIIMTFVLASYAWRRSALTKNGLAALLAALQPRYTKAVGTR